MRYYARAFSPSGDSSGALAKLFNWFYRARDQYFALPRFQFEAITLGLALLFGLLVMPALIYLAGHIALRDYAHGGLFSLYGDFFKGLFAPRPSFWVVVVGPLVFLTLLRVFRWSLRKT
jgi:hypothetical protein